MNELTDDYDFNEPENCPECNGEGERDYGTCHLCSGTGVVDRLPAESFYEVESIRVEISSGDI